MADRPEGCKCDFRTYMVGDGCPACNPELWEWLLRPDDEDDTCVYHQRNLTQTITTNGSVIYTCVDCDRED